jgi:spermidine synthase
VCIGSLAYVLGYLTPKQIDEFSGGNPNIIGSAYAINLLGCIIGPLVASYLLLPVIGSRLSLLVLSVPLIILFFNKNNRPFPLSLFSNEAAAFVLSILVVGTAGFGTTYEEWLNVPKKIVKNDYNATVLAATLDINNARSKYLMVNGMGITSLTPITKMMAHLPLFALPEGPKRALVICFGMGTTFRSMASWGIPTTAVELTPSVGELFPYFFDDARQVLAREGNSIIIDDGRRFLERTSEIYDVITIDPPPPVEAAGSSLLYSEEFYKAIKDHLTPSGILAQWYPEKEGKTLQAVARSLVDVFPYVNAYLSIEGGGYHFLASNSPITIPSPEQIVQHMPKAAQTDLMEWNDYNEPDLLSFVQKIVGGKQDIRELLNTNEKIKITDDQPYNEYFLLHG